MPVENFTLCDLCIAGNHSQHFNVRCTVRPTGGQRCTCTTSASTSLFVEREDAFSRAFELNADEIHRAYASSQIAEGW